MSRKRAKNLLEFKEDYGVGDLERIVAEDDRMLAQYYVGHKHYLDRALKREDPASVFIGPKGVGKSAVLQMVRLHEESAGNSNRLIEIAPDDMAFSALLNIKRKSPLLDRPGDSQHLFKTLWDYVLCVALLEREHRDRHTIEQALRRLFGSKHEREQKRLLKAALDDTGNTRTMTEKMLGLVEEIEVQGSFSGTGAGLKLKTRENQSPKGSDLSTLQLINNVAKELPKTLQHKYFILVDDLDLHWKGTSLQNAFLGSLFYSIRKLSWSETIKFVVSLRKRIYREVDLEERDKFSQLVCEMEWRPALIKQMTEKRLSHALKVSESEVWNGLFPSGTFDRVLGQTDGTPREAIRLAGGCVKEAIRNNNNRVTDEDVAHAIVRFSESRLDDLQSDNMYNLPGLRLVVKEFLGGRKEFDLEYLRDVAYRLFEIEDDSSGTSIDWARAGFEDPLSLAQRLVQCGFLLVKDGRDAYPRKIEDRDLELLSSSNWFAIHPMYHAGLQLEGT